MKVAEYSEVPITPKEFLKSDFRERCINIIPIKKEQDITQKEQKMTSSMMCIYF